ncbi:alpha-aminoadipic semialdehyde synthase, mitochondrial-like isoform X2 [Sycon ciliatum]|uniref:alpha-aminoadipic semialdehyde synthase, mitochondrial-like isoform X2 n=1 Tax=Sycon ciliatum TaxID=27933 RepID=UPI0031F658D2
MMWLLRQRSSCSALLAARGQIFSTSVRNGSSTSQKSPSVGILREESQVWERRAVLAPHHVQALVKKGVRVVVQPSTRRAYSMYEYETVGAELHEDLSGCDVILGVRSPNPETLIPHKTYAFFSHTIKAQEAGMPLLDTCIHKHIRLLDYEKIVDGTGKRVVAFGHYAGAAGMVNILHGLGLRLLALGHHTPFMHLGGAHNYPGSSAAKAAIANIGREIEYGLMPEVLGPMIFVICGDGGVSKGAHDVLNELPVQMIDPSEVEEISKGGDHRRVYATVVKREDHLERIDGGGFNLEEFNTFPERYRSTFAEKIAPFATVIVNGIYWQPKQPRLLTTADAKTVLRKTAPTDPEAEIPGVPRLPHRLLAICDISADLHGSIEFMRSYTSFDNMFHIYNPETDQSVSGNFSEDGIVVMSIDNLPAQLPREATDNFGDQLRHFISPLTRADWSKNFSDLDLPDTIKQAFITSGGRLTPNFKYIDQLRAARSPKAERRVAPEEPKYRVVVFGSGLVAKPLVDYLAKNGVAVCVATAAVEEGNTLIANTPNCSVKPVDATNPAEVRDAVRGAQLAVSVLPAPLHPRVAQACLDENVHMLTASYTSPELAEFDTRAKEKNLVFLNELGLDPGIDHLLAMQCIDEVRDHGGEITSFVSWCGGLPAPEDSDNPLRYKFSWSPLAVLGNVLRPAAYWQDNNDVLVADGGGLLDAAEPIDFMPGFSLQGIPNRDSRTYRDSYGIQSAHTCKRGTLRYTGYVDAMKALVKLGVISTDQHPRLQPGSAPITWRDLMAMLVAPTDARGSDLESCVLQLLDGNTQTMQAVIDLGLLSSDPVSLIGTPLDALSDKLSSELVFGPSERDMVVLHHRFHITWTSSTASKSIEQRDIALVQYGQPHGDTAMAVTVGLTAAIGAKLILQGAIRHRGVLLPFTPDIYTPIIKELAAHNVKPIIRSRWEH